METIDSHSTPQRSRFVTITAWFFIFLGTITTVISLIQGLMYVRMLSMPNMHQAMHEGAQHLPLLLQLIFEHFRLYLFFVFSLSLSILISAIGLLKRKKPARKFFIAVLAVMGVALLAAFITQLASSPATDNIPTAQIPENAKNILRAMKGFMFILTFFVSCLFGWIISHLTSTEIRNEFTQKNSPEAP